MELFKSPSDRYHQLLLQGVIEKNDAQMDVLRVMDDIWSQISANSTKPRKWWRVPVRPALVKGMYLWGGVGCGKTLLMDLLYHSFSEGIAIRVHFHRFMGQVHERLTALQGQKDPLKLIAAEWSKLAKAICFDEFFVSDITDAMLLAGLFTALVEKGVVFVMTSNIEPQRLYEEGLQRARFLPAIDLIVQTSRVIELDSGVDYRLRTLRKSQLYLHPVDSEANEKINHIFIELAKDTEGIEREVDLSINHRPLLAQAVCDDVLWVTFDSMCLGLKSVQDYVVVSSRFQTVLLTGVPQLTDDRADAVKRFIHLVDEFYDRRVKLIISAACPLIELYRGERLKFEFERTRSRLWEMQSDIYLARAHRR